MKLDSISHLRCPNTIKKNEPVSLCGGTLGISEIEAPALFNKNDKDDVLEALVKCNLCRELYPVIRGVLILPPSVRTYIRDNYSHICRAIVETNIPDQPFPPRMKEFLIECGGREARPTTPDAWDQNLPNVLSRYIQAHYGNITEQLERNPGPWPDFVKAYVDSGADLYSVLLSMVGKALSGNQGLSAGIAVDAGCSVGKLTYELAPNFQSVYGVDLSFSAILTARRIVNRSPVPQTSYSIVTDAGRWSNSIPIQVHDRPNVEFLVSSATDLPFETGSLSFLATVNLIDVLPQPEALFRESARVLGEQRSLLMADPYCWKDTGASQEHYSSSEYVVESLLEHGFMVTEHRDSIPWLLRLHDRRWDTYLCDCFGAVKTSKSGKEEKIQ